MKIQNSYRWIPVLTRSSGIAFAVLAFTIGCQTSTRRTSYSRGNGTSIPTAVLIRGATNENVLEEAEYAWIQKSFPSAIIRYRALAFDPLTGLAADSEIPVNVRPGEFCDVVQFQIGNGSTNLAYFAYDYDQLRAPPEDLRLLYRGIDLIQRGEIHPGMTLDALRRCMTTDWWFEDVNLFFRDDSVLAMLSERRSRLSLYAGQPGPMWHIIFTIKEGIVVNYSIAKWSK